MTSIDFLDPVRRWLTNLAQADRVKSSRRVLAAHLPLSGCVSYAAFNLHVSLRHGLPGLWGGQCGPTLVRALLLHSHLGIGLHLYHRARLGPSLGLRRRLMHTAYLTVIFNFGSILLVAAAKSYLPSSETLRGILALLLSFGLISSGLDILSLVSRPDGQISKE